MEAGKACKSGDITATPSRTAPTTRKTQQREREQDVPKKLRSAMKKELTDFFSQGKRAPGPTTAGNPIDTVIQRRVLKVGTPMGKGDSRAGSGGADGLHQQLACCPKPSDQPRDAARREECSDLDEKSLTTFCR